MRVEWDEGAGGAGVSRGWLEFDNPALSGFRWPLIEIVGDADGPRLCVMGSVHVNEASSIEAAITLSDRIDPGAVKGRISVIPVVNQSAQYHYTVESPADGKNIHWLFPGDRSGTFSDALAHHLLFDWAAGSAALVDMHGGDIGEIQSPYVVYQRTGDAAIDARHEALARCFPTDWLVGVDPAVSESPGRSCTALGKIGRAGLVSEAGDHAVLTGAHADWHARGVLNAARLLGVLDGEVDVDLERRSAVVIEEYVFARAPVDGLYYPRHEPGILVEKGQKLGEIRDTFGRRVADVEAPDDGIVMWRWCIQFARAGAWIGAVGRLREEHAGRAVSG